jgi:hypothetical protein
LLQEQAPAQSVSESRTKGIGGEQNKLAQIADEGDERRADGNEKTRDHFRPSPSSSLRDQEASGCVFDFSRISSGTAPMNRGSSPILRNIARSSRRVIAVSSISR